ncbi:histone transcription regulator HIRA, WD repeat superfamily [Elsinoe ampelina]|uniref:Protein HIR n=1 Tax=Elsinoe ampelina TaxID=302913 RepID=A0A6A6GC53_9PEZI|nr:histone transcription regulator HIRA, WD repeat superfamily [Elsinoe ampelina]
MRFTKPLWLTHGGDKKDYEVYSCHVSPDGQRLVTAAGDGHVRIWSTEAILNTNDPKYENKPKQLASLSYHSGTIHSVRFSPNQKYLASGADDKIVCIYTLDPNPPSHTTFGSNETPPVENWRIYRRLIGHDNDVQDLGWSHDSSILVSVGLDSKVVVWSGYTFEKLRTLSQHQSHVKGITFDPANKYFATASDDRTIKVYRFQSPDAKATAYDQANNFTLETSISAPFSASPLTTYFRRPSWSPDGAHLTAANAVNGPVSSVAVITRGSWESDISLIGHEGPVEVCAFSPRMYTRQQPNPADQTPQASVTVVACAGQDKTLSVWNTSVPRPFVVTQELAAKSISDLAWSPDGMHLYFSSLDGTIAVCSFAQKELGYATPVADTDKALQRFGGSRRAGIIENADALRLEQSSKADELRGAQGRMGELMGDGNDGPAPAINGDSSKVNGTAATTNGDTTAGATSATNGEAAPPPDPQVARIDKLKQRVTITKDGKKRIQPLLVSASGSGQSSLPQSQLVVQSSRGVRDDAPTNILDLSKPYDGLPKGGLASLILGQKRKFAEIEGDEEKRAEKRIQAVQESGAIPILMNTSGGLVPPSHATPASKDTPAALRPSVISPSLSVSQIRLAVPLIRPSITRPLELFPQRDKSATNSTEDTSVLFEARNSLGPSRTGRPQDRNPTRVTLSRRGQVLWQDYVPRHVLLATGNRHFWAVGCDDGSIHIWTPAGRRMLNSLVLPAQPVILDCRGWYLLAVSAVGECSVYNLRSLSSPHPPISLAPVLDAAATAMQDHLTASPAIMFARLNSQGRIVVGVSNGDGYAYNPSMYVWQRLSEPWWAVGSQYWNTSDTSLTTSSGPVKPSTTSPSASPLDDVDAVTAHQISAGIIPLLERNTTSQTLLKGRAFFLQRLVRSLLSAEGYEGFESAVSVAHLENRVAAAMMLGAREEFRMYLVTYARRLGSEGLRGKVQELLASLVGAVDGGEGEDGGGEEGRGWFGETGEVVGWDRKELGREVVLILGKHRDLQRITVPYARALGVLGVQTNGSGSGNGEGEEMVTDS